MNRLQKLQIEQLDLTFEKLKPLGGVSKPFVGWLKTIRETLGMRLAQAGDRLGVSRQSFSDFEKREAQGTITLHKLEEAARALDCKLVYAIVPVDGTLQSLIERKARLIAKEVVMRTSITMELEDQAILEKRLLEAIEEQTMILREEMPKSLWD